MLPLALLALAQPGPPLFELRTGVAPASAPQALALDAADLVSVRRAGRPRPGWPRGPQVILSNGDRLAATVVGGDARAVWVRTAFTGGNAGDHLALPLSAVAAVWFVAPPADAPPDPGRYPWAEGRKRTDGVLLLDGDVRRGVVEAVTADGVRLAKTGALPTAQIAAVAFDPTLGRVRPVAGRHFRAVLADGSRLTLATATVEGTRLRGKLAAGPDVALPVDDVVAVDVRNGPAVYLSDLPPVRQTVEGFAGSGWPWAADRTVRGLPLRVGRDQFDKGLGTHPRTVLTFPLDGKFRRFEAVVGIDPLAGGDATASVRVLLDGKAVATPAVTTVPTPVAVEVTGAKELTLEVGYGPFGGVRADVNWGDARLIP